MKVQHFVLTRLAQERLILFRTYCVPAMEHQTRGDYSAWLIFCDETTDPAMLGQVESSIEALPKAQVALTSDVQGIGVPEVVRGQVDDDCDVVITTALESDDCLHSETIERVREYAKPFSDSANRELLLNFPRGYRFDATAARLYETTWMRGPFSSLLERAAGNAAGIRTVYGADPGRNDRPARLHFDYSFPAWIRPIQGSAEGVEIDPAEVGTAFGVDLTRPAPDGVPTAASGASAPAG